MSRTMKKVTVTLDRDIVRALDERAQRDEHHSRSAALQEVLREWQREEALKRLEEETAEYYDAMAAEERREDDEWAELAGRAAARTWPEP